MDESSRSRDDFNWTDAAGWAITIINGVLAKVPALGVCNIDQFINWLQDTPGMVQLYEETCIGQNVETMSNIATLFANDMVNGRVDSWPIRQALGPYDKGFWDFQAKVRPSNPKRDEDGEIVGFPVDVAPPRKVSVDIPRRVIYVRVTIAAPKGRKAKAPIVPVGQKRAYFDD